MHIWSVANHKGGVGKTTLVVTLGGMLAERGKKTLLIDMDPHHSLTNYFGYSSTVLKKTVYDLFETCSNGDTSENNSMLIKTRFDHLYLLPASPAMVTLEQQLCGKEGLGNRLKDFLNSIKESFSYIIIDCPSMLGLYVTNAIIACRHIIIPVQLEFLSIKGLEAMIASINSINMLMKQDTPYTIVPNLVNSRSKSARLMQDKINSMYNNNSISVPIPIDPQFNEASIHGIPLPFYKKDFKSKDNCIELISILSQTRES